MFKSFLFQAHWVVGITAGVVLAFVGLTGGMLSFESEIQAWLNRNVRTVEVQAAARLSPPALLEAIGRRYPDKRVTAVTVSSSPDESARVTFALPQQRGDVAPQSPPGRGPRGEVRYVNPYDGTLIDGDGTRGQQFFRTTRSLHRWLVAGDFGSQELGRQLVGASTLLCVLLALSGLYLRWPRRRGSWRTWLTFDPSLKGRSFLWHLHAILGTWVLIGFLLMSLTGPYWSLEWYRNGLYALAGVDRPAPRGGSRPAEPQERPESTTRGPRGEAREREAAPSGSPNLEIAWTAFGAATAKDGYSTATVTLPQDARRPVEIRYMDADPAHDRAFNTLSVDALTGKVARHERYIDKDLGDKFMSSIFPLHSGSFFGLPGVLAYMIASLSMPVFAVTGWMMYLDRRRKKRAANAARRSLGQSSAARESLEDAEPVLVAYASQAGNGRQIAWQTAGALRAAGIEAIVCALEKIELHQLERTTRALFVISTFGAGEPPDDARVFAKRAMHSPSSLASLRFGLLALGDSHFENFCGFGVVFDQWLKDRGATELFPTIMVDNGDPAALARWQKQLTVFNAGIGNSLWNEPAFEDWRLVHRTVLNPGSVGGATFHIELDAPSAAALDWRAGDIAEVQPANPVPSVNSFLAGHALDGDVLVTTAGSSNALPLRDVLKYHELPTAPRGLTTEDIAKDLVPLPKREFSIASIPTDGRIHLVVRQSRREDGSLGLGSGWLTAHAALGESIRIRIRSNPGFHPPPVSTPLILIGNGTGIAGLRSHLKARAAAQSSPKSWLIFGERNAQHDFYYQDEIDAWKTADLLGRVDLAFSRDQSARVYVQHLLHDQAERLRAWIREGASILVCGSAKGMAPGVETALIEVLGGDSLSRLAAEGRYRRDVY